MRMGAKISSKMALVRPGTARHSWILRLPAAARQFELQGPPPGRSGEVPNAAARIGCINPGMTTERIMHSRHIVLADCVLGWMAVSARALGGQDVSALQVRDAGVGWLPGNLPAGGYITLVNTGDQPMSLIAASCPDYADVSLHRSRNDAGTSQMMPVHKITVAPHSSLAFAAHGYHLMLSHP